MDRDWAWGSRTYHIGSTTQKMMMKARNRERKRARPRFDPFGRVDLHRSPPSSRRHAPASLYNAERGPRWHARLCHGRRPSPRSSVAVCCFPEMRGRHPYPSGSSDPTPDVNPPMSVPVIHPHLCPREPARDAFLGGDSRGEAQVRIDSKACFFGFDKMEGKLEPRNLERGSLDFSRLSYFRSVCFSFDFVHRIIAVNDSFSKWGDDFLGYVSPQWSIDVANLANYLSWYIVLCKI